VLHPGHHPHGDEGVEPVFTRALLNSPRTPHSLELSKGHTDWAKHTASPRLRRTPRVAMIRRTALQKERN
jgi:hypothetical protein